jgi:polyferredoxin
MSVRKHDWVAHGMRVVACLLMLAAAAVALRGRVWGREVGGGEESAVEAGEMSGAVGWGGWTAVQAASVGVLALAAAVPLFSRSRRWRTVQLALDVAVLGVWGGQFLSTARMTGWAGSGLPGGAGDWTAAVLMLSMAFLWPLFGRKSHYCLHACPFGAAQELASRLPAKRWRVGTAAARRLAWVRRGLWAGLMLSTWCCAWGGWMEWEVFGAFAWRAAPWWMLGAAAGFVALSAFVPRAYCRFVCPTGTLFKMAEADGAGEEER